VPMVAILNRRTRPSTVEDRLRVPPGAAAPGGPSYALYPFALRRSRWPASPRVRSCRISSMAPDRATPAGSPGLATRASAGQRPDAAVRQRNLCEPHRS
jgi:hypothetical protein